MKWLKSLTKCFLPVAAMFGAFIVTVSPVRNRNVWFLFWYQSRPVCPRSDETSLCEVLLHPSVHVFDQERLPANKQTNKRSVPVRVPSQTWVDLPESLQSERSRFRPFVSQSAILNPRGVRGQLPTARPDTGASGVSSRSESPSLRRRHLHDSGDLLVTS